MQTEHRRGVSLINGSVQYHTPFGFSVYSVPVSGGRQNIETSSGDCALPLWHLEFT